MPGRSKIFLVHARADAAASDAVRAAIATRLSRHHRLESVEAWSEDRIIAGTFFDRTVRQALAEARIVVFLMSRNLAAYVSQISGDLSDAFESWQRRDLEIVWVGLDQEFDIDGVRFTPARPHGAPGQSVTLRSIPHVGSSAKPSAHIALRSNEDSLSEIADAVVRLLAAPMVPSKSGEKRPVLTIDVRGFDRPGVAIVNFRDSAGHRFAESQTSFPPGKAPTVDQLFDLLFFPQRNQGSMWSRVVEALQLSLAGPDDGFSPEAEVTPIGVPIHLRLCIDPSVPELFGAPWHLLKWNRTELGNYWIIEQTSSITKSHEIGLVNPHAIRLVARRIDHDSTGAILSIFDKIEHWSGGRIKKQDALDSKSYDIHVPAQLACVFGEGRVKNQRIEFSLDDQWLPIDQVLKNAGPIVFVQVIGPAELDGIAFDIPPIGCELLLWRRLDPGEASKPESIDRVVSLFENFLHALIASGPRAFSATAALHAAGLLKLAKLRSRGSDVRLEFTEHATSTTPTSRILARITLDRVEQRRAVREAYEHLIDKRELRCIAALGYGGEGNLTELLGIQAAQYIAPRELRRAPFKRIQILPGDKIVQRADISELWQLILKSLGVRSDDEFAKSVAALVPKAPGQRIGILLLDWKNVVLPEGNALDPKVEAFVESWARLHAEKVALHCPNEVRILSIMGLTGSVDAYAPLKALASKIYREHPDRRFSFELLDRLDNVDEKKIADCIRDLGAPVEIEREFAKLAFLNYGGKFDATARAIESAQEDGWHAKLAELRRMGEEKQG